MFAENAIVFDIETIKNAVADKFMPEFEPDGRLSDPEKKRQSVINKQEAWSDKCALDPVTGMIVCISYHTKDEVYVEAVNDGRLPTVDGVVLIAFGDEKDLLKSFWKKYSTRTSQYLVGWNNHEFDMWFIYQRSLINNLKPPINPLSHNWDMSIDLMEVWNRFNRRKMSALNEVAKAVGLGEKTEEGDVSARFGYFWEHNRVLALTSAIQDATLTWGVMNILL